MRVSIEEREFRKAIRAISSMPTRTARRVIGASMRAAARVVRKKTRRNLPKRTGLLRRSVRVATYRRKKRRGSGNLQVNYIQTIMAPRKGKRDPHYGIFVEKGYLSRGGRKIPGKNTLRNSFRTSLSEQRQAMIKETTKQVARQLERLRARSRVR